MFLAAPGQAPVPGFTGTLAGALTRYLFRDPAVARLVVEPDVRHERALRRWQRLGFTFGPLIDLPEKRAQLAFLRRAEAKT